MYKTLLKEYINKIKKEDIIKYIEKNNLKVSDKEIDTIYFYIKNYWEDIYDNKKEIWEKLSKDVSSQTFITIESLYQKYKKFIG